MKYKFPCEIVAVTEKFGMRHISGVGKAAVFEEVSLGWFIHIGCAMGTQEISLGIGTSSSGLKAGDRAILTLEKA